MEGWLGSGTLLRRCDGLRGANGGNKSACCRARGGQMCVAWVINLEIGSTHVDKMAGGNLSWRLDAISQLPFKAVNCAENTFCDFLYTFSILNCHKYTGLLFCSSVWACLVCEFRLKGPSVPQTALTKETPTYLYSFLILAVTSGLPWIFF